MGKEHYLETVVVRWLFRNSRRACKGMHTGGWCAHGHGWHCDGAHGGNPLQEGELFASSLRVLGCSLASVQRFEGLGAPCRIIASCSSATVNSRCKFGARTVNLLPISYQSITMLWEWCFHNSTLTEAMLAKDGFGCLFECQIFGYFSSIMDK